MTRRVRGTRLTLAKLRAMRDAMPRYYQLPIPRVVVCDFCHECRVESDTRRIPVDRSIICKECDKALGKGEEK